MINKKQFIERLKSLRIPGVFDDVLKDIRKIAPSAIIAGGAIRDLDHDVPMKDIDIFIPADTRREFQKLLPELFNVFGAWEKKDVEEDYEIHEVVDLVNFTYYGIPIQIIGIRTREKLNTAQFANHVLKTFDFGLNKIAYIGDSKFVHTPEYRSDRSLETLTLCYVRSPFQLIKLMKKYERLIDKLGPRKLQYKTSAFKGGVKVKKELWRV